MDVNHIRGSSLLRGSYFMAHKEDDEERMEPRSFPDSGTVKDEIKLAQERCRRRYAESREKYNNYFLKCLDDIEALQPSAFAGVQVSRIFTVGVLPKYCKIKDPLSPKQRKRVERIIQG